MLAVDKTVCVIGKTLLAVVAILLAVGKTLTDVRKILLAVILALHITLPGVACGFQADHDCQQLK